MAPDTRKAGIAPAVHGCMTFLSVESVFSDGRQALSSLLRARHDRMTKWGSLPGIACEERVGLDEFKCREGADDPVIIQRPGTALAGFLPRRNLHRFAIARR